MSKAFTAAPRVSHGRPWWFSAAQVLGLVVSLFCLSMLFSASALAAEAPVVESSFVTKVTSGSARLEAVINPGGAATRYWFEYDTVEYSGSAPHGKGGPATEGDVGSGVVGVHVHVDVQSLAPGTTYHFSRCGDEWGSR